MKLEVLRKKHGFICDMDGVVYHGNHLLPGAKRFVNWLKRENKKFAYRPGYVLPTVGDLADS